MSKENMETVKVISDKGAMAIIAAFDASHLEYAITRLSTDIERLFGNNRITPENKIEAIKKGIESLAECAPSHSLLEKARNELDRYISERFEKESAEPEFQAVGSIECVCPYCSVELEKYPQRKTTCKSCGKPIYSKKRPLDNEKVLLREDEIAALENDWAQDYLHKQKQPRLLSPLWQERTDKAMTTECDPDPAVEKAARALFSSRVAARDVPEYLAQKTTDQAFITKVEIRVWQLQVRSMNGKS
jgi:hypothetical protein